MGVGRLRSRRVALSAAFVGLAASTVSCSSGPDPDDAQNVFYCVDADDTIVNEENCDDDRDNRHYLAYGALPLGMLIGSRLTGHNRFSARDTASRTSWGLPATGRVSNGTVKTGIIGKGGSGTGVTSGS